MILKKYKNNLRPLFTLLALATVLFGGANLAGAQVERGKLFDFTGSGRTSFVTLQANRGPITWTIAGNPQDPRPNQAFIRQFIYGNSLLDIPVPENYTGDTKAEPTVWRDENGTYYVAQSPVGTAGITVERAVQWGAKDDDPTAMGDYDGDGRADYTVVRETGNVFVWYIMSSSTNTMRAIPFGSTSAGLPTGSFVDVFPGADFTGDGRDELVFVSVPPDQQTTTFSIGDAVTGAGVLTRNFGAFISDVIVPPDDYTGDGRADLVTVRQTDGSPAIWFILNVATNTFTSTRFGIANPGFDPAFTSTDNPVRGDYDGDGRHDVAVFRQSNQTFYWINSGSSTLSVGSQVMPTTVRGVALASLDNFF